MALMRHLNREIHHLNDVNRGSYRRCAPAQQICDIDRAAIAMDAPWRHDLRLWLRRAEIVGIRRLIILLVGWERTTRHATQPFHGAARSISFIYLFVRNDTYIHISRGTHCCLLPYYITPP